MSGSRKDRRLLIVLYRWFPSILQVLTIIRPETLIHWHRSGFSCYWLERDNLDENLDAVRCEGDGR